MWTCRGRKVQMKKSEKGDKNKKIKNYGGGKEEKLFEGRVKKEIIGV